MADQLTFDLPGMGRIVERHVVVSGTLSCVEAQPARSLGWGDSGVALVSWEVRSLGITSVPRAAGGEDDSLLKVGVAITELHALDESQREAFEGVLSAMRAKAAGGWSDDEDRPLRGIA